LWNFELISSDTLAFVYLFPPFGAMVELSSTSYCAYQAHSFMALPFTIYTERLVAHI
jgi:hypothetical protein